MIICSSRSYRSTKNKRPPSKLKNIFDLPSTLYRSLLDPDRSTESPVYTTNINTYLHNHRCVPNVHFSPFFFFFFLILLFAIRCENSLPRRGVEQIYWQRVFALATGRSHYETIDGWVPRLSQRKRIGRFCKAAAENRTIKAHPFKGNTSNDTFVYLHYVYTQTGEYSLDGVTMKLDSKKKINKKIIIIFLQK